MKKGLRGGEAGKGGNGVGNFVIEDKAQTGKTNEKKDWGQKQS